MRKLNYLLLLISSTTFAQKVISEVSFKENKQPLDVIYLPNQDKVVMTLGERTSKAYGNIITDVWAFDKDGFTQKLVANEKLANCVFSPIETAFLIGKLPEKNEFPSEYKLILDGVPTKYFTINERFRYFNDIYGLDFVNQKENTKIDLKNDDVFLKVIDLFGSKVVKNKLEKPDLNKLENKTTATFTEGFDFDVRINESDLSFITKSINKNYKSATIYRTVYNLEGSKTGDYSYFVSEPKHFLLLSNNGSGVVDPSNTKKLSELAVNNYLVDKNSGNVYVYGLFGSEAKEITNSTNIPLGFYIFKYDSNGKLLWESHQEVLDPLGFNQNQDVSKINFSIRLRDNEVFCSIFSKDRNYLNTVTINDNDGLKKSQSSLKFKKSQDNTSKDLLKVDLLDNDYANFKFDKESLYLLDSSQNFQQYIKTIDKNKSLNYKTYLSKKGYWVIESDNKTQCKVLFFS
ncbi:hypothetical protein [Flavobacterium terrae]|uniref:Uncharacterized protein n=1 Tax=Flavobacterium terrae TaxID=415425 RepID=A0A1M6HBD0_9FLAO|nr:hypothetical protein [Flavobacterium terrae]SHJ19522.1 hypothetical protein SAMN05444363_2950 [Flavobacterium terrae]